MLKGAQNIQPRATQLAFAHGLRVRSPFCDPELTQWTFSLSSSLYLRGTCEKYILKQAAAKWLPPEIVWREKRGMGVPLTFWCFHHLWSDLGQWLNPSDLRAEGLWQADLPAKILSGQLGGIQGRRMGEALWFTVDVAAMATYSIGGYCNGVGVGPSFLAAPLALANPTEAIKIWLLDEVSR